MKLRFAHLADHATTDARGKLIIVGVFDQVLNAPGAPIALPTGCWLVVSLEAHPTEGSHHRVETRICRESDGSVVHRFEIPVRLTATGPMRRLRGQFMVQLNGVTFPEPGGYYFEFFVDGRALAGKLPVYAEQQPA